jgi:sugar O-acyltransferase (sialic acid O-acetyltransferase NeuD family)
MKVLLYGSKSFSDVLAELARDCGHEVAGKVDDINHGPSILGSLSDVSKSHCPGDYGIILAIGYNNLASRWDAWRRIREMGYECPKLIHPRAYVASSARVGDGTFVMAGAIVDTKANLGEASVLWPSSCVNHDAIIGDNCFLSPQTTICGFTRVGSHSFIGAGSVVVDSCEIPAGSFVKAHSLIKQKIRP